MSGIILDIDDVVGLLGEELNRILNERFDVSIPFDDFKEYNYFEQYGMSSVEFFDMINNKDFYSSIPFDQGAVAAINKIQSAGVEVNMVTSRGTLTNAESITADWLEKGGVIPDRLLVVPKGMTKSSQYRRIGNDFMYIVDDLPENIMDAMGSGIVQRFALIERPWNKGSDFNSSLVSRHKSLFDFANHIINPGDIG